MFSFLVTFIKISFKVEKSSTVKIMIKKSNKLSKNLVKACQKCLIGVL